MLNNHNNNNDVPRPPPPAPANNDIPNNNQNDVRNIWLEAAVEERALMDGDIRLLDISCGGGF